MLPPSMPLDIEQPISSAISTGGSTFRATDRLDYQGNVRRDQTYSVSGDLIYKLNRIIWLKGTLRRDWLESNVIGARSNSTVVMLGVRMQNQVVTRQPRLSRRHRRHVSRPPRRLAAARPPAGHSSSRRQGDVKSLG